MQIPRSRLQHVRLNQHPGHTVSASARTAWNHLGALKKIYGCPGHTPRGSNLIGLEEGPGIGIFKSKDFSEPDAQPHWKPLRPTPVSGTAGPQGLAPLSNGQLFPTMFSHTSAFLLPSLPPTRSSARAGPVSRSFSHSCGLTQHLAQQPLHVCYACLWLNDWKRAVIWLRCKNTLSVEPTGKAAELQ